MSICVIFNPVARGEKARRLRRHLEEVASQCALKLTTGPGAARGLAAEAVREGFQTIVAAGGDGTLNEVLNGIGDEPNGWTQSRLAMLPLGTVNVFAREFGVPIGLRAAWETILRGNETVIDLPYADYQVQGRPQRRFFAQLAGAGLDARAIELINWDLKKKIGPLAYVEAGLRAWRGEQPKITVRHGSHSLTGELILIGNGRLYGGNLRLFPLADARDGLLEVCCFKRVNWTALARCGWGLLTNRLHSQGGVECFRAAELELTSIPGAPFEVEGETVGQLPARIGLLPQRLRIVVP